MDGECECKLSIGTNFIGRNKTRAEFLGNMLQALCCCLLLLLLLTYCILCCMMRVLYCSPVANTLVQYDQCTRARLLPLLVLTSECVDNLFAKLVARRDDGQRSPRRYGKLSRIRKWFGGIERAILASGWHLIAIHRRLARFQWSRCTQVALSLRLRREFERS